ncbi:MAG: Prokaryotic metallothionein [Sulfurospirillaceae bacterium]|jgi:uncharacterized protein|nr:Prokaryotic metallothionein [Sulfurospirillaceae bacterium]MCK9545636.1 Prokaryotic metallothionein [Sulfurospirillaceae bacterium]MDY0238093.1 PP0621 family protein [Campylobacterales bacterium]NLN00071.1 Prokaryotic metallothionein [Campylobacteraceae bacterium]
MVFKIVFLIIALVLVYLFFFKLSRGETPKAKSKKLEGEIMVECAACKTFVVDKDAIIKDGQFFCSKECAKL